MNKLIILAILSFSLSSQAQTEILAACAMANGSLVHKVSIKDKKFVGQFDFPSYRDLTVDPNGATQSLNAPLSNDTTFISSLNFLNRKSDFLRTLFGKDFHLNVDFEYCEQQQSTDGKLKAFFCNTTKDVEINGLKIERIDFSLQNQTRTSLVGSEGQTANFDVYYADLSFKTAANEKGIQTVYKSSMSYFPNGNDIQCLIK